MRIREILFHNFRSFRGERRISFVDPVTDTVRPLTVLAGSNGSGKTSVLEAIEALLSFALNLSSSNELISEAQQTGLILLTLEFDRHEISELEGDKLYKDDASLKRMHIGVGRRELASLMPEADYSFFKSDTKRQTSNAQIEQFRRMVSRQQESESKLHGGLLFFPHDRRIAKNRGGALESPKDKPRWLFRFTSSDKWKGSLEQLWVWQDYLDLGKSRLEPFEPLNQDNLKPFVESVEEVLGSDRQITTSEGRVLVPVGWKDEHGESPQVRLDQLPSGEQQVLLLFGELARRRRPGAVIAIDELENSLHPTLQRLAMWNLARLAREWEAQIIVTTHSLEVINSVRGGAFINLDYPRDRFNLSVPELEEAPA